MCSDRDLRRGFWDTHKDKAPNPGWNSWARLPGLGLHLGLKGFGGTDETNGDKDGSGAGIQVEEAAEQWKEEQEEG